MNNLFQSHLKHKKIKLNTFLLIIYKKNSNKILVFNMYFN